MTVLYLVLILAFMILWWLSKEMNTAIKNQQDSKRRFNEQLSSETSEQDQLLDSDKITSHKKGQISSSKGRLINIVMEEGKIVERTYRKNNGSIYKVRS